MMKKDSSQTGEREREREKKTYEQERPTLMQKDKIRQPKRSTQAAEETPPNSPEIKEIGDAESIKAPCAGSSLVNRLQTVRCRRC